MPILLILLILMLPTHAFSEVDRIKIDELHESASSNIAKLFIEDVISLLPSDFKQHLKSDTILRSVKFRNYNNKWMKNNKTSESDLFNVYKRIATSYELGKMDDNTLSDELGNTISSLVEASMFQDNGDLLGEKFKQNIDSFLREDYKKTHIIRYEGYDGSDIKTCISKIYELSKYSKASIYPLMVTRTAALWSAVHNAKVKHVNQEAKVLKRQPLNVAFANRQSDRYSSALENARANGYDARNNSSRGNGSDYAGNNQGNEQEPNFIILIPVR